MLISRRSRSLLAALGVSLIASSLAYADEPSPKTLFDGSSLAGWSGGVEGWQVVDGILESKPDLYAHLYADGEYADFVLSFEFRLTPGANNGVALRAPGDGDPAYVGMESQILDNTAEKYASLEDYQYHGSIYGVVAARRGALKPAGEWNTETIRCEGDRVQVVLNGETIVDADLREAAPDGKTLDGKPHPGLSRSSGKIGFLGHGDRVGFRNVTILELKK